MTGVNRVPALAGLLVAIFVAAAALGVGAARAGPDKDDVGWLHYQAVFAAVPTLLLGMRVQYRGAPAYLEALRALTDEAIEGWLEGGLWLEAHPEVRAHPAYRLIKLEAYELIDPEFRRFLGGNRSRAENMRIRLEEIYWGGVPVDGIPPLDNPAMVAAEEAGYLVDDDLVFGLEIDGDARAYPLRILGWHEMMNDVVGGVPVALAYCTLCGSGILRLRHSLRDRRGGPSAALRLLLNRPALSLQQADVRPGDRQRLEPVHRRAGHGAPGR
jgi:hypothetical protein